MRARAETDKWPDWKRGAAPDMVGFTVAEPEESPDLPPHERWVCDSCRASVRDNGVLRGPFVPWSWEHPSLHARYGKHGYSWGNRDCGPLHPETQQEAYVRWAMKGGWE